MFKGIYDKKGMVNIKLFKGGIDEYKSDKKKINILIFHRIKK